MADGAVRFGLQIGSYTFGNETGPAWFARLVAYARSAEEAGVDDLFAVDHLCQIPTNGEPDEPMPEAFTTLAALATLTTRIRLGTLVASVTHRQPAVVAKAVSMIDVVSGGRALLGLGIGWSAAEHDMYGIPFPSLAERYEQLENYARVATAMFRDDVAHVDGSVWSLHAARNVPRPVRTGGPEILIGGSGEKRTLPLAAVHADVVSLLGGSPEVVTHKLAVLDEHCLTVGRDPAEIVRMTSVNIVVGRSSTEAEDRAGTLLARRLDRSRLHGIPVDAEALKASTLVGTPADVAKGLNEYVARGVQGFAVSNFSFPSEASLEPFRDVIDIVRR